MTENILNRLEKRYSAGCKLLSNHKDRELLSVAAFLEIAGVGFQAVQLEACRNDPPDIIFRPNILSEHQKADCAFEVTELLDKDTKRNHELWESFKAVESTITQGRSYEDYVSQSNIVLKPMSAITFAALLGLIEKRITVKNIKYRKRNIRTEDIDLLVKIQLKNLFMKPNEKIYSPDTSLMKDWRSISFLMESCCGVIYLGKHAPQVLRGINRRGLIYVNNRPEIWDEMIHKLGLPY